MKSETPRLEAKEARWEVVSGAEADAYTFNGTVPGPTIRAKEGDTIRVNLKNSLQEETAKRNLLSCLGGGIYPKPAKSKRKKAEMTGCPGCPKNRQPK